jgi:hypothetical protein
LAGLADIDSGGDRVSIGGTFDLAIKSALELGYNDDAKKLEQFRDDSN